MKKLNVLILFISIIVLTACGGGGGTSAADVSSPTDTPDTSTPDTSTPDTSTPSVTVSVNDDTDPSTATLKIEKFGQGNVIGSDSLSCTETFCSEDYTSGQTIQLTAVPDSGWQLNGWTGCDSVSGAVCTVTMSDDAAVFPTFERIAPPTLEDTVEILSSATVAKIASLLDNAIIFNSDATEIAAMSAGTIIVSTVDGGFARRIENIIALSGSTITVETSDVPLDDVIKEGTIIYNDPLTTSDLASVSTVRGIRYVEPTGRAVPTTFTFDVDVAVTSGFNVKGAVELSITPDFALDIGWTGVNEFKIAADVSVKPSLEMSVSDGVDILEKEFELPIPAMTFVPIIIGPVVLTPEVQGVLKVKADAKAKLIVNGWVQVSSKAGARYLKSTGWKGIGNVNLNSSFDPLDIKGEATAEAMVGPEFSVKIYKIAGPRIFVGPYVKSSAAYEIIDDCGEWGINAGAKGVTSLKGGLLGWNIKTVDISLFDAGWKIVGDKFGACADTEAPSEPAGVTVSDSQPTSLKVSWSESTDNYLMDKYELYRDNVKIFETTSTSYIDKNLTPDTDYCYSVIAVDSNNNKSAESGAECGKTGLAEDTTGPSVPTGVTVSVLSSSAVDISWSPSTDSSGDVSYLVYESGTTKVLKSTDTTSASVLMLDSGSNYCFQVAAVDSAGNKSALSSEACATTTSTGNYRMRSRCDFSSTYVVDTTLDFNESVSSSISVVGSATDYDGSPMTYVLSGTYESSEQSIDAQIDWAFENSDCARTDVFTADLSSGDTGDVTMTQTSYCGCTAMIRFTKEDSRSTERPMVFSVMEKFVTETFSGN